MGHAKDRPIPFVRRRLSGDLMIKMLRHRFDSIPDTRRAASVNFPLTDVLMAAYAMFCFKDASLLAFQNRFEGPNVRSIFGIRDVPSDTQMREILDPISEEPLHEAFADLLRLVISEKDLLKFRAEDGRYYAAIDGTGYFSSERVHCDRCQEKRHKNGSVTYSHHAVAMVLLHPDRTEVLPLGVEPILKQDGNNKNDCERNAVRRLLKRVRLQHPTLPLTVIEDGLASNGPHIRDLKEAKCHFILGAKPGDHQHLFDQAIAAGDRGELHNIEAVSPQLKNGKRETQWASGLALNSSHPDLRVTFLSQHDFDPEGNELRMFSWVTDLEVTPVNAQRLARAARARWRIENETFNVMKNRGYHLEHNYGHGYANLSTVLLLLMFLAFLTDQIQEAFCPLFGAALKSFEQRIRFWDDLRSYAKLVECGTYERLLRAVLTRMQPEYAMGAP